MASRITEITFALLLFPLVFSMIGMWGVFDQQYYSMPLTEYEGYKISNLSEYANKPAWQEVPITLVTWAWGAIMGIIDIITKFFWIYPQLVAMFPIVPDYVWLIINFAYWFNFILFFLSLRYPQFGEHT